MTVGQKCGNYCVNLCFVPFDIFTVMRGHARQLNTEINQHCRVDFN